jgi:multiple sugar transport system ATP-binding protein
MFENGVFSGESVRIEGLQHAVSGPAILGFRAEDARVTAPKAGAVSAPVYSFELLGDATLVTVKAGRTLAAVRADKGFRAAIGEPIGIAIEPGKCHLFEPEGGRRIAPAATGEKAPAAITATA